MTIITHSNSKIPFIIESINIKYCKHAIGKLYSILYIYSATPSDATPSDVTPSDATASGKMTAPASGVV